MRCSSCEPLLDRYLEATLPPQRMAAVAAHLTACDACASLLGELRVVDGLLETTTQAELAPNFTFAVMAELHGVPVRTPRRFSFFAVLAFYLVGAWIGVTTLYAAFGGHVPQLVHAIGSFASIGGQTAATVSGIVHAFAPATPIAILVVGIVLLADLLLAAAAIYVHRAVRPRLAAVLSRSEAP